MGLESEKYPKVIYKFRDWKDDYHKKVLQNNELYVPSVNELNDPFDCLIKFDYSIIESEGLTQRVVDLFFQEFGNKISELGYSREFLIGNTDSNVISTLIELKKYYDGIFEENRKKHLGVISFSKNWENLLMWSHYSNSHKGFCVGFNTEKLINSKFFHNGCRVFYPEKYPLVNPLKEEFKQVVDVFYNKSSDWSYEEEYRMTKLFGYHQNNDEFEKQKIFNFENHYIKEVILGWKIPVSDKEQILSICNEKNISVYQTEVVSNNFKLNKERIN